MALGDMFLKVDGCKGESQDAAHGGEIELVSWSWGMRSDTSLGGAGAAGKSTINELKVVKRADSASTALMSLLRNNAKVGKVLLTARKAGGSPLEYVKVTLQNARITSIEIESGAIGDQAEIVERVHFAFKRITVEYVPQGADGQAQGATTFMAEID